MHVSNVLPVPYIIRRSKRAKHLRVIVRPGEIIITAPSRTSESDIKNFILAHEEWILRKYRYFDQFVSNCGRNRAFLGGEEISFMGKRLNLVVVESDLPNRVTLDDCRLIIYISHGLEAEEKQKEITGKLEQWLKDRAREFVTGLAIDMSKELRVQFKDIRIKNQKTRWGSCSRQGNLNFNWRLIMAPPEVFQYVVAHEVSHLVHMNHSRKFWETVESILPGYARPKKWLKENGRILQW